MTPQALSEPLPLHRVIRNVAREVGRLHGPLSELETAAIEGDGSALGNRDARARLQAFDRLSQHVVALSTFLDRLSIAVPEDAEVDARPDIAAIPLGEIRQGLLADLAACPLTTPSPSVEPDPASRAQAGNDVDLF